MSIASDLQDRYEDLNQGLVFRDLWDGQYDYTPDVTTVCASHWHKAIKSQNVAYNLSGGLNIPVIGAAYPIEEIYEDSPNLYGNWHYGVFYAHDANSDKRALPQFTWPDLPSTFPNPIKTAPIPNPDKPFDVHTSLLSSGEIVRAGRRVVVDAEGSC